MKSTHKFLIVLTLLVAFALLLSACGWGGAGSRIAPTQTPGGPTETPCGCSVEGAPTQATRIPFQEPGVTAPTP